MRDNNREGKLKKDEERKSGGEERRKKVGRPKKIEELGRERRGTEREYWMY